VASGEHRDKLVKEFVIEEDQNDLNEKIHFSLQDYVRYEDLFTYGMTPQFLGRFDEVIVLNDLTIQGLIRIFVEPPDALYREARRYFRSLGIELQVTKEALKQVAEAAYENHRLGARALRMVFKRILRGIEFDPQGSYHLEDQDGRKILRITKDMVDRFS
jgi:ATP-dependent Clp protease ATP-binding subunit ClpX